MERVGEGATSNVHKGDTEAKGEGRVPFSDIIQSQCESSSSRRFLFLDDSAIFVKKLLNPDPLIDQVAILIRKAAPVEKCTMEDLLAATLKITHV